MLDHTQPLIRTDRANTKLTIGMVITALALLIIGNNDVTDGVQFVGIDVKGAFLNIGLALLIAAITQYYTDFRVRSNFYRDVTDSIVANQTLANSGILKFFRDSKTCLPDKLMENVRTLDIGMVYSDRLIKDNIGAIEKRGDELTIRIFCPDQDDEATLQNIAHNVGRSVQQIKREYEKLDSVLETISQHGVIIEKHTQKSMPHYSFYIIDNTNFFITFSTFSSRRATVPLFQVENGSPLADLVLDDIEQLIGVESKSEALT